LLFEVVDELFEEALPLDFFVADVLLEVLGEVV
jgi:hypothetical protein